MGETYRGRLKVKFADIEIFLQKCYVMKICLNGIFRKRTLKSQVGLKSGNMAFKAQK